jgi:hypothetical protein
LLLSFVAEAVHVSSGYNKVLQHLPSWLSGADVEPHIGALRRRLAQNIDVSSNDEPTQQKASTAVGAIYACTGQVPPIHIPHSDCSLTRSYSLARKITQLEGTSVIWVMSDDACKHAHVLTSGVHAIHTKKTHKKSEISTWNLNV